MTEATPMLDAHGVPPKVLKELYKRYQKLKLDDLDTDLEILDFKRAQIQADIELLELIESSRLASIFSGFAKEECSNLSMLKDAPVYSHKRLPGLLILPALLPLGVQKSVLSRLLHRDLSDPRHKTNIHLHYTVPYPLASGVGPRRLEGTSAVVNDRLSFFSYSSLSETVFMARDPAIHQPLSISRALQKNLRWITLGGQYDWTNKVYPNETPPEFPADIGALLGGLFPNTKPQAAIVNLYSPGDTLSLHRDVSERSDKGLISISIGCDCLFVIGNEHLSDGLVIRLRSGDGLYMDKDARFAWHGVPRILPNTCPSGLQSWPAGSGQFEDWRGWMSNKRINLNARQMSH